MIEKTALGISIGDLICVSYHDTGNPIDPVETIWGPYYWTCNSVEGLITWPYPVISVSIYKGKGGINNIHLDGNRWFTDQGDEVLVKKVAQKRKFVQIDLFSEFTELTSDPRIAPYPFNASVDYSDRKHVFHCLDCGSDFNGDMWNGGYACPPCPLCKTRQLSVHITVMSAVVPGKRYWSAYQRYLGFDGSPTQLEGR